ncbi:MULTISPECIES: hypothetical protein [unclassified Streptomyces]|uniref:hypothetical protein n=1 Tax=unclassified Streptomyces TaxID=2593676 RepID=UPI002271E6D9|nr:MULTISPECIES: hypothetical protein [unclassified Streptomyces]MCY0919443.1 hypothetical protein [Streptomyces sp. H27-G5]MCY0956832.1 hypothetical protein [Streptomyces sp. H27-H5]
MSGGTLIVTAGRGVNNDITIRRQGGVVLVSDAAAELRTAAPCKPSSQGGAECPVPTAVQANGQDGDDASTVSPNLDAPATLYGGSGKDQLNGGPHADRLVGDEGTDTLDAVDGVSANDSLDGGLAIDSCARDTGDTMVNCP